MTAVTRLTALACALLLAGCSASGETSADTTEPLVIDVHIAGGTVTPTNASLQASVKQSIVLNVDSDAADELHVHSNPEHSFDVEPKAGQRFEFSVDVPGRVDVELHHLERTVATIAVGGA